MNDDVLALTRRLVDAQVGDADQRRLATDAVLADASPDLVAEIAVAATLATRLLAETVVEQITARRSVADLEAPPDEAAVARILDVIFGTMRDEPSG